MKHSQHAAHLARLLVLTALVLAALAISPALQTQSVQAAPPQQGGDLTCDSVSFGSLSDARYGDSWHLQGTAGTTVTVTMNRTSGNLDSFVQMDGPNGGHWEDDDSGGDGNAYLVVTLPVDGQYNIGAVRYGFLNGDTSGEYILVVNCEVRDPVQGGGDVQPVPAPGPGNQGGATIDEGVIACGADMANSLSDQAPYDRWYLDAVGGETLTVVVRSTDFDAYLTATAPNSALTEDDDSGGGLDARLVIPSAQAGRYMFQVRSVGGSGNYRFTLNCSAVAQPPAQPAPGNQGGATIDEGVIVCGADMANSLGAQALYDRWYLDATSGQSITARASSTDIDAFLTVTAPDGTLLVDDDSGGGLNAQVVIASAQAGRYAFQVTSVNGYGTYRFTLTCGAAAQPPAQPGGQPGVGLVLPIGCGDTMSSTINNQTWHDRWVFRTFTGGETLTFTMVATSGNLDPYMDLYDQNDHWTTSDNDSGGGRNARLTYTTTAPGWYTIDAGRAGGQNASSTGTYDVTLTCQNAAQPPAQPQPGAQGGVGLQMPILCGHTAGSTINNQTWYDEWYYSATAGEVITVTMVPTGGDLDPYVDIYDPNHDWRASDDDSGGGLNAQLTYTIPTTGWYTLSATRMGGQNGTTSGTYNLTLACQGGGQPPAQPQPGAGPIVWAGPGFPSWVVDQGNIFCMETQTFGIDNNNWYHEWWFDGLATQQVSIDMARTSGDLDPYLILVYPDGTWVEDDDSGGNQDARIGVTLPVTGTYKIQTTRFDRDQGSTAGQYNLSVSCLSGGNPPAQPPAQPGAVRVDVAPIDLYDEVVMPWPMATASVYVEGWENATPLLASVDEAIAFWSSNAAFTFNVVTDPAQADIVIRQPVQIGPMTGGAQAYVYRTTGKLPAQQVTIDVADSPDLGFDANQYSLAHVMIHAMGHALGLEHSEYSGAVMYPVVPRGQITLTGLAPDDVDQLVARYGPQIVSPAGRYVAPSFVSRRFEVQPGESLTLTLPYPAGVTSVGSNNANLVGMCPIEGYATGANAPLTWECSWTWDDGQRLATFTITTSTTSATRDGVLIGQAIIVSNSAYRLVDSASINMGNNEVRNVPLNAPAGTVVVATVQRYNPAGAVGFGFSMAPSPTSGYEIRTFDGNVNSSLTASLWVFQPVTGYYVSGLNVAGGMAGIDEIVVSPDLEALTFGALTVYQPNGATDYGVVGSALIQALSDDSTSACYFMDPAATGMLCVRAGGYYTNGLPQSYGEVSYYIFQLQ